MSDSRAVTIQPSSFAEVLPIWREQLWPGRTSEITPTSAINSLGQIDMELMTARPLFFVARRADQNEIVGVISGMPTSNTEFRSRGIWVNPDLRSHGIGSALMRALMAAATETGHTKIWTMPRASAFGFYQALDFAVIGSTDAYEFGPHFLMARPIRDTSEVVNKSLSL